jgi:hypothetical protein
MLMGLAQGDKRPGLLQDERSAIGPIASSMPTGGRAGTTISLFIDGAVLPTPDQAAPRTSERWSRLALMEFTWACDVVPVSWGSIKGQQQS